MKITATPAPPATGSRRGNGSDKWYRLVIPPQTWHATRVLVTMIPLAAPALACSEITEGGRP